VRLDTDAGAAVGAYLHALREAQVSLEGRFNLVNHPGRRKRFDGVVLLTHAQLLNHDGVGTATFTPGEPITVRIGFDMRTQVSARNVSFILLLHGAQEQRLGFSSSDSGRNPWTVLEPHGEVDCRIPHLQVGPGSYSLSVLCRVAGGWSDAVYGALPFDVVPLGADGPGYPAGFENLTLLDCAWARASDSR